MRSHTVKTFAAGVLVSGTLFLSYGVLSQEHGGLSQEEMMKQMEVAARPGPQHAQLAKWVGRWKQTIQSWEPGSTDPQASEGTMESKSILGGRFVVESIKGNMNWGGETRPFEGFGIHGFDNAKQKYFYVWFDTNGTSYMTAEGVADATGNVITYMSECDMGEGPVPVKSVSRHIGPDESVFEMYVPGGETEWFKNMEIRSTRAKTATGSGH